MTLQGLGEPLLQLRELIKDMWYRNSQERRLGDLAVTEKRIELCERLLCLESGVPPSAQPSDSTRRSRVPLGVETWTTSPGAAPMSALATGDSAESLPDLRSASVAPTMV